MRTAHFRKNQLHENWTLGKRLREEENLLREKCRKDWEEGGPDRRRGSKAEFILRRREGEWGGDLVDAFLSCPGTPQGVGRHGGVEPCLAGLHRWLQKYPGASRSMYVYMYVWLLRMFLSMPACSAQVSEIAQSLKSYGHFSDLVVAIALSQRHVGFDFLE